MYAAYQITWMESESGWGQRVDGISLYPSLQKAEEAISDHWIEEKRRNPSGIVPEIYVRPERPVLVEITKEVHDRLQRDPTGELWIK